jgi:hypothetical protein
MQPAEMETFQLFQLITAVTALNAGLAAAAAAAHDARVVSPARDGAVTPPVVTDSDAAEAPFVQIPIIQRYSPKIPGGPGLKLARRRSRP